MLIQRDAVVKGRPVANRDRKSVPAGPPPGVGGVKIGGGDAKAKGGPQGAKAKGQKLRTEFVLSHSFHMICNLLTLVEASEKIIETREISHIQ